MPFAKAAVEAFISTRAAAVSKCGASDMTGAEPDSPYWLSNVGLSIIFNDFPPASARPFVINFIRRISAAFLEYDLARKDVVKLIKDGHGRWSPYFTALTHFEAAVAQLYLALDSVRKLRTHDFFRKGDGSFEESLNLIYNASKHELASGELPVWFTDSGMRTANASVTFDEIEDFMLKMPRW